MCYETVDEIPSMSTPPPQGSLCADTLLQVKDSPDFCDKNCDDLLDFVCGVDYEHVDQFCTIFYMKGNRNLEIELDANYIKEDMLIEITALPWSMHNYVVWTIVAFTIFLMFGSWILANHLVGLLKQIARGNKPQSIEFN